MALKQNPQKPFDVTPNTRRILIGDKTFYLADLGKRFKGQLIDGWMAMLLLIVSSFFSWAFPDVGSVLFTISMVIGIIYILFADGMTNGQSIGKLFSNTKTINIETGKPCTYLQSFVRNIFYAIEIVDYIFIFSGNRQRLGDMLAKTVVVYSDDEPTTWLQKLIEGKKLKQQAELARQRQMTNSEVVISWIKTLGGAIVVVTILNGILIASFVVPTGSMENTVMTGEFLFVNKFKYGPSTPQIIPILNIPLPFYKTPPIWSPKQGDVIVFIYPGDREEVKHEEFMYYLKRCVAVSGDTLKIVNDSVYVNGVQFHLPPGGKYIDNPTYHDESYTFPVGKNFTRSNYGPIRIPKMGDVITLTNDNFNEWNIFIQREGHKVERNGDDFMIDGVKTNSYIVNRDYVFGMGDNRNNSLDSRYWGFIPKQDVVGTPMMVYWSWETEDRNGRPLSMFKKLSKIRWSRLGSIIN